MSYRLADALYKSFRAVKEAPRSIQRLSTEVGCLHNLLQEADGLVKRYSTSLSVTKDGLSIDVLQSLLQECQAELAEIQKTTATFQKKPSKFKSVSKNVKWVLDEPKIKQHYELLEGLERRIDTALSVAGR